MQDKWIVLVGDPDTNEWSVAVNAVQEHKAREFYDEMRMSGDQTPAIVLYTGDFVTV